MKTKLQPSDATNLQQDKHTEASGSSKEVNNSTAETTNTFHPEESKKPLRTTDMNLLKHYSQFFIELS